MSVQFPDVLCHIHAADPMLKLNMSSTIQKLTLYHKLSLHRPTFPSTVSKAVGVIIANSSYKYTYQTVEQKKNGASLDYPFHTEESKQSNKQKSSKRRYPKKSRVSRLIDKVRPVPAGKRFKSKGISDVYTDDSINMTHNTQRLNESSDSVDSNRGNGGVNDSFQSLNLDFESMKTEQ